MIGEELHLAGGQSEVIRQSIGLVREYPWHRNVELLGNLSQSQQMIINSLTKNCLRTIKSANQFNFIVITQKHKS